MLVIPCLHTDIFSRCVFTPQNFSVCSEQWFWNILNYMKSWELVFVSHSSTLFSIGIALTIHILLILVILGIIPIIFWNKSPPFSPDTVEPRSIWCSYFWIICSYIRPGLGTGCPWIPIPSQVSHFYFLSKPFNYFGLLILGFLTYFLLFYFLFLYTVHSLNDLFHSCLSQRQANMFPEWCTVLFF